jgi:hypothetical protein
MGAVKKIKAGPPTRGLLIKTFKRTFLTAILSAFIGMLLATLFATDWQTRAKKTWEFKAQQGVVKIALLADSSSPKSSSLEILYEDGAHPSLTEEVGYVREVLHQLPALALDPGSVHSICMRGFAEPEVAERVAIAALHSRAWGTFTTTAGGAERVVEDMLNATGAYDPFNEAFKEYGLVISVKGVEKVASARCLGLKLSDSSCTPQHNPRVPVGANLCLILLKKK